MRYSLLAAWPPIAMMTAAMALVPFPGLAGIWSDVALLGVAYYYAFDAASRLTDFATIRRELLSAKLTGSNTLLSARLTRLVHNYRGSFCRRTAMTWAAESALQHGAYTVTTLYRAMGYGRFRLLPDWIVGEAR